MVMQLHMTTAFSRCPFDGAPPFPPTGVDGAETDAGFIELT